MMGLVLNILMAALEICSCVRCLRVSGVNVLKFYTILSNILGGISAVCYAVTVLVSGSLPQWALMLRYFASVCLMQTFLVVMLVLLPMAVKSGDSLNELLWRDTQKFHHIFCPLLTCVSFLFFEGGGRFTAGQVLLAALPTLLYALVTIPLNWFRLMDGPYPFLKVHEQKWYMSVLWFIVILGLSAVIAAALNALRI